MRPRDLYIRLLERSLGATASDADDQRRIEKNRVPMVVISGDHDIGLPVENWPGVQQKWRSLFVFILPYAGNAARHQYPELTARLMGNFVGTDTGLDIRVRNGVAF